MHKYNRLFFSVLVFLIACKSNSVPDGIIKLDEMTHLMTDVHITDGTMYNVMQVPDTLYKYGTSRYVTLFKKYHTDSVQFRKSFQYYTSHPDKLQVIYTQVTANLKLKTDSLNKLNQDKITRDNKRRTDSLKKLPKKPLAQPLIPITPAKPGIQPRPHLPFKSPKRNAVPN
jgi:hypothetical protein